MTNNKRKVMSNKEIETKHKCKVSSNDQKVTNNEQRETTKILKLAANKRQ